MPTFVTSLLGTFSLLAFLLCYRTTLDNVDNLSPQGCRMSWMSPSYVQQLGFNASWSPLARRYSLWLYREVGWDSVQETGPRTESLPVLFIPGNAGSSHQIRSIASSATRQYYSSPYVVSPAFKSHSLNPLDFFAVEFNEDLSAFHGSTLESQIAYTSQAISYILSLYPPSTKIIVMGHSMGGVVATSLLPSSNISAIITMSTPHTLPPARFDSRIDTLYSRLQKSLEEDTTPIVSICGGATDMMIPSESCILPKSSKGIFRRTVFTSALEGAWTGVGHREMVWCHQVRWRVARAALELGGARTLASRTVILDKWLRAGHPLPLETSSTDQDENWEVSDQSSFETLQIGQNLALKNPSFPKTYLLPVDDSANPPQRLTVVVSQGHISSVSPENAIPLRVSVLSCTGVPPTSVRCVTLKPETLKLVPNPVPGKPFPVPHEGSDESDGVVLYEALVPQFGGHHWIGVEVDNVDGRGWIVAGLDTKKLVISNASTFSLLLGSLSLSVPSDEGLATSFAFPNLLSNALVVYRMTPHQALMPLCSGALMPPLLAHTSHPTETHYFPLANARNRRILLHTHSLAPFIDQISYPSSGLNFTIYSSGERGCKREFETFDVAIDWSATLGRWASRYINTLVSWAAGVASLVVFTAWSQQDREGPMPSVERSLENYARFMFHYLLPGSLAFSMLPLPQSLYMGNGGVFFLAPVTPLILLIASGLVCVVWWILLLLLTVIGISSVHFFGSRTEKVSIAKSTIFSLTIICAAIFVFVPWQVAYLGCWLLHLHTCASSIPYLGRDISKNGSGAVPLVDLVKRRDSTDSPSYPPPVAQANSLSDARDVKRENANHNLHLLLLMTWLLPLTAPVLAVWVRTLLTAGYTTPFDGDHNFLAVLPFLILTDFASWTPGALFEKASFEKRVSLRWVFVAIAGTAFLYGSRRPYLVFDAARAAMWSIVICRIGRRYWGASSWPT